MLADLDFEPDFSDGDITLRNCPFRELVDTHRDLVCSLHAGMLEGVAGGASVRLLPFTTPHSCTVRMHDA